MTQYVIGVVVGIFSIRILPENNFWAAMALLFGIVVLGEIVDGIVKNNSAKKEKENE